MEKFNCSDLPYKDRLDMVKMAIVFKRLGKDYMLRTYNKDGWFAGSVTCVSTSNTPCPGNNDHCDIIKSGYIFSSSKEASDWVTRFISDLKDSITLSDVKAFIEKANKLNESKGED